MWQWVTWPEKLLSLWNNRSKLAGVWMPEASCSYRELCLILKSQDPCIVFWSAAQLVQVWFVLCLFFSLQPLLHGVTGAIKQVSSHSFSFLRKMTGSCFLSPYTESEKGVWGKVEPQSSPLEHRNKGFLIMQDVCPGGLVTLFSLSGAGCSF